MESLNLCEFNRRSVQRSLSFTTSVTDVGEFALYMSLLSPATECVVVADVPGDVVVRRTVPQLNRSQTRHVIQGLLLKHLSHMRYRAGVAVPVRLPAVSRVKHSVDASLFALGNAIEKTCWFPVLSDAAPQIAGLYSASMLSELAFKDLLATHHRLLLCLSVDMSSLRFLYFEHGILSFTRVVSFVVADDVQTLKQIQDTRLYILDEYSALPNEPLVTAIARDILPANHSVPDRVTGEAGAVQIVVHSLTGSGDGLARSISREIIDTGGSIAEAGLVSYVAATHKLPGFTQSGLRHSLKPRDCRSPDMRQSRREFLYGRARQSLVTGLCWTLVLVVTVTLSCGIYLSRVNAVMRGKLNGPGVDIAYSGTRLDSRGQGVLRMRDAVLFRQDISAQMADPKALLQDLANVVDLNESITLTSITWALTRGSTEHQGSSEVEINSRSTLPQFPDKVRSPNSTLLKLEGFINAGYQSMSEGYAWYQQLLSALEEQNQFDLIVQDAVPFSTPGRMTGNPDGVNTHSENFSLLLAYKGRMQ